MSLTTYTAPSGKQFTYQPAGGDKDRIKSLVELLCDSITTGADAAQHTGNMFQAATCLFMELGSIQRDISGFGENDEYLEATIAVQRGLSAWITRNSPEGNQ